MHWYLLFLSECLGTYDSTQEFYTDTEVDQYYRSWEWFVCNEVGYFQDGAPKDQPSLVSRLVQPDGDVVSAHFPDFTVLHLTFIQRTCTYYFPELYKNGVFSPNTNNTNVKYQGWDVRRPRIFFGTGRSKHYL
jgi:hypothetical protein